MPTEMTFMSAIRSDRSHRQYTSLTIYEPDKNRIADRPRSPRIYRRTSIIILLAIKRMALYGLRPYQRNGPGTDLPDLFKN